MESGGVDWQVQSKGDPQPVRLFACLSMRSLMEATGLDLVRFQFFTKICSCTLCVIDPNDSLSMTAPNSAYSYSKIACLAAGYPQTWNALQRACPLYIIGALRY